MIFCLWLAGHSIFCNPFVRGKKFVPEGPLWSKGTSVKKKFWAGKLRKFLTPSLASWPIFTTYTKRPLYIETRSHFKSINGFFIPKNAQIYFQKKKSFQFCIRHVHVKLWWVRLKYKPKNSMSNNWCKRRYFLVLVNKSIFG